MTDYSQQGEQEHILANTPAVGRFLDIGAYHAKIFSNTRALYERGWSGVMIEPSPGPFESLLREYGNEDRVTLICAAVSVGGEGLVTLYATQDALSTTDKKWYRDLMKRDGYNGGFYGSFRIPTIDVVDLDEFGPFDFVSVDTEGTSEAIAEDAVLSLGVLPKCICSEQTKPTQLVIDLGYKVVYQNGTNVIYVKH